MKVFLSWSGDRSKRVAEALRDWLPGALQAVEPWLSSRDAAVGRRWASSLATALEEAQVAIVCLTKENIRAEWLQFEAGAVSGLSDDVLLCLYALDVEATTIDGPLSQFQIVQADSVGTLRLLEALNQSARGPKLSDRQLERAFNLWWPELAKPLAAIPAPPAETGASLEDRLARAVELLEELVGRRQAEVPPPSAAGAVDVGRPSDKRPRVFVASSSRGLPVTRAVHQLLAPVADVSSWDQSFDIGKTVFDSLQDLRLLVDFAVIVLTADDRGTDRGLARPSDNLFLELGFFAGALGRARTFLLMPAGPTVPLPSDLSGLTVAQYQTGRDLVASLAPVIAQITRAMGVATGSE
jgi:predicted nucleotide-binding protein